MTIERVPNRETASCLKAMVNVVSLYAKKGMKIQDLIVDPEFGTQRFQDVLRRSGINVNVASAKEHVSGIERKTRVLKERVRARRSALPYKKMPIIMTVDLAKDVVSWLNSFPSKSALMPNVGVRSLITGVQFDYNLHCRVEFGQYCQVHEDKDRKNRVDLERTTGSIALRHSGNLQGGYRFLSLNTGRVIVRQHFTVCPITKQVIERVEELGRRDEKNRKRINEDEDELTIEHFAEQEAFKDQEIVENDKEEQELILGDEDEKKSKKMSLKIT